MRGLGTIINALAILTGGICCSVSGGCRHLIENAGGIRFWDDACHNGYHDDDSFSGSGGIDRRNH